jgi:ABC-2 type transport system ATP-binding protein
MQSNIDVAVSAGQEGGAGDSAESAAHPLIARDVAVRFGLVVALDGFSVDIPRGTVGLLGPNGAGKSTFIKASLGLVAPASGAIFVAGRNSRTQSLQIRDDVGYMPEHDCLIPSMNAVELVSYFAMISGMSAKDGMQRGHEVLDFVDLGEERYRPIKSYSTGMKQKVKLAQAIVHDPSLLFLDEPTSGMDPQGREEMLDLIRKIGASDKTVIVSSHILQEIERVCDHVVIMSNGKVIREGDVDSLVAGEKGVHRIVARGEADSLSRYAESLRAVCEVLEAMDEGHRQMAFVVKDIRDGGQIFRLAGQNRVQIRSYRPERLDLEEVFLRSFDGGARDGH